MLAVVTGAHSRLSALQVCQAARAFSPDIGLTTVYRTLAVLEEVGAIRRLHGDDACETVVPAAAEHGHTIVCDTCDAVEEFTACDISGIAAAATAETGYAVTSHFLQLSGRCRVCRAEDEVTG